MSEKDYSAQQRHLRTHYVRFSLDLRPEMLAEFRAACAAHGTTPTTEIKKFIASYCDASNHPPLAGQDVKEKE
ncbi:MAG: hypothetical protein PUJ24_09595 [Bacteroidales bacterium]|nr:hypothetical protein [Bacteroidales bacterium]